METMQPGKGSCCRVLVCLLSLWAFPGLALAADPDPYEEDDVYSQAGVIVINSPTAQTHNFHDAGDADWVEFLGITGEAYTIRTNNLGSNCDTVIELYDTNGTTMLTSRDDGGTGEDESLDYSFAADGIYYVKVRHYDAAEYGDNTEYDLKVFKPIGPFSGFIEGLVKDASTGAPLGRAQLKTNVNVTALSESGGSYLMVHPPGAYTLTASFGGYDPWSGPVTVAEGTTVTKNISLVKPNGGGCAAVGSAEASTHGCPKMGRFAPAHVLLLLIAPAAAILFRMMAGKKERRCTQEIDILELGRQMKV